MNSTFESERLYLRALEIEDHHVVHKWRRDPGYQAGVLSTKRTTSLETERRWIERAIAEHEEGRTLRFAVVLRESESFIGLVFLTNIDHVHKRAGSAWWIGEENNRGKGYITEARHLLVHYAFEELNLRRIEARTLASNAASTRSAETFGYTKEGLLRQHTYKNGRPNDVLVFSLLKEDYKEMHSDK